MAEKEARPRRAHVQATATAGRRTPKAAQRLDVRGVWVARAREQCAAAAEQSTERRVSEEASAAGTSPASAQRHSLHAWRPSSAGTPPVSARCGGGVAISGPRAAFGASAAQAPRRRARLRSAPEAGGAPCPAPRTPSGHSCSGDAAAATRRECHVWHCSDEASSIDKVEPTRERSVARSWQPAGAAREARTAMQNLEGGRGETDGGGPKTMGRGKEADVRDMEQTRWKRMRSLCEREQRDAR